MRIKKTYNGVVPNGKILNSYSTSQNDGYSCDFVNSLFNQIGSRIYTRFRNTLTTSSFGINVGTMDRETYLVLGTTNNLGSVLSIITSSSSTTNVKNLGTVNLTVSRVGSQISVSGLSSYSYVLVMSYDDFSLFL